MRTLPRLCLVPGDRPSHLDDQLLVGQRLAQRVAQVTFRHPCLQLSPPDGGHYRNPTLQEPVGGVMESPPVVSLDVIQPYQRGGEIVHRELTQPFQRGLPRIQQRMAAEKEPGRLGGRA